MSHENEHIEPKARRFTFRIFRYGGEGNSEPRFDSYELESVPGMTVLSALFEIQQKQDTSVSFRFSCRGAVCGSCGMTINGHCGLACRTQLSLLPTNEVVLEPLPNLDVIRDLVVDMDPFWEKYRRIRPWLHREIDAQAQADAAGSEGKLTEIQQSPREFSRIEQYTNCILCACCYGSCPVPKRQPDYVGPAALAKLLRFVDDSRDERARELLEEVDTSDGVWGSDTVNRCNDACPKDVRPTDGIAALRRRLVTYRVGKALRVGRKSDAPSA
jgi:succinate dehydrogenase / fumarate reductase iron-sulfur subunit